MKTMKHKDSNILYKRHDFVLDYNHFTLIYKLASIQASLHRCTDKRAHSYSRKLVEYSYIYHT